MLAYSSFRLRLIIKHLRILCYIIDWQEFELIETNIANQCASSEWLKTQVFGRNAYTTLILGLFACTDA